MKHIYRFGDKGYVQMDSYPENHETRPGDIIANAIMAAIVIAIATFTAGALVGVDITNIQPTSTQQSK
jgi:hypothetical protein